MMGKIINHENIDIYRKSLNGNYYDSVKSTLLNILEVAHEDMLENNQITEDMLDEITDNIVEDEEFNDYIDSLIHNQISKYREEKNLEQEEEI